MQKKIFWKNNHKINSRLIFIFLRVSWCVLVQATRLDSKLTIVWYNTIMVQSPSGTFFRPLGAVSGNVHI